MLRFLTAQEINVPNPHAVQRSTVNAIKINKSLGYYN